MIILLLCSRGWRNCYFMFVTSTGPSSGDWEEVGQVAVVCISSCPVSWSWFIGVGVALLPVSCLAATDWHTRMWLQADLSGSERLRGGCLLATEDAALADWRHTECSGSSLVSVCQSHSPHHHSLQSHSPVFSDSWYFRVPQSEWSWLTVSPPSLTDADWRWSHPQDCCQWVAGWRAGQGGEVTPSCCPCPVSCCPSPSSPQVMPCSTWATQTPSGCTMIYCLITTS